MKIYHISEKQLAGMKEQIDKLHDLAGALNANVAFSDPEIRRNDINDIMYKHLPMLDLEKRDEFIEELFDLCIDAVSNAADEFDETAVTALNEAAGSIERELKFLVEDIERCSDGADN